MTNRLVDHSIAIKKWQKSLYELNCQAAKDAKSCIICRQINRKKLFANSFSISFTDPLFHCKFSLPDSTWRNSLSGDKRMSRSVKMSLSLNLVLWNNAIYSRGCSYIIRFGPLSSILVSVNKWRHTCWKRIKKKEIGELWILSFRLSLPGYKWFLVIIVMISKWSYEVKFREYCFIGGSSHWYLLTD